MVTRQRKGTGTRRRAMQPETRRAPTAETPPTPMTEMKSRFEAARGRVRTASHAATKFARSYMREVTTAAKASREPMQTLLHNFRMAGRHIARDAKTMWHEVVPMESLKLPVVRRARRPAA